MDPTSLADMIERLERIEKKLDTALAKLEDELRYWKWITDKREPPE